MAVKYRLFCSCKKSQKKKKKPLRMTAFYSLDVCDFARVKEREQGQRGAANVSSILDGNICYQLQLETAKIIQAPLGIAAHREIYTKFSIFAI